MLRSRKYSIQPTTTTPNSKQRERAKCISTGGVSAASIGWVGPITLQRRARPELENERHRDIALYLSVQEVKNLSNRGRYFCEICLDRIPYARTTSRNSDSTVFWGENFDLNNLPEVSVLTINLYKQRDFFKEKRYRSKTQNQFIAFVTVSLTNCTTQDAVRPQWFTMQPSQAVTKTTILPNRTNSTDSSSPTSPPTPVTTSADGGMQREVATPGSIRFRKRSTPVSCFRPPGMSSTSFVSVTERPDNVMYTSNGGKKTVWSTGFSMDSSFKQTGATSETLSPKSPKTSNTTAFPFHNQILPQIRLQIRYEVTDVLPIYYYEGLRKFIANNYRSLVGCLEPGLSAKQKEAVASCLVHLFDKLPELNVVQLLTDMLEDELMKNSDPALIFRSNSIGSKAMECYMKLVGSEYLTRLLKPYIDQLLSSDDDYELDPSRIANSHEFNGNFTTSQTDRNLNALLASLRLVWQRIQVSGNYLPNELRIIFNTLGEITRRYCSVEAATRLTSSFLFLRFICPAIHGPLLYGLANAVPESNRVSRNLTLIAKVLQNLANLTLFGEKEVHMEAVNVFVESELSNMCTFLHKITSFTEMGESEQLFTLHDHHRFIDNGYEFARLSKILILYEEQFDGELSELTFLLRLIEHHTQATLTPDWPPSSDSIPTIPCYMISCNSDNQNVGTIDGSLSTTKFVTGSNNWRSDSVHEFQSNYPSMKNPSLQSQTTELVGQLQLHTQLAPPTISTSSHQASTLPIHSVSSMKSLPQPCDSDQSSLLDQSFKRSIELGIDCHGHQSVDADVELGMNADQLLTAKDSKGCQTDDDTKFILSNNNKIVHCDENVSGVRTLHVDKSVGSVHKVGELTDGNEDNSSPTYSPGLIKAATSDNALSGLNHSLEESPSLDQLAERMQEMKLILQQKRQEAEKTAACRVQTIRNREESLERMVNHVDQLRMTTQFHSDHSEVIEQQQPHQALVTNVTNIPQTISPSSPCFSSGYPDLSTSGTFFKDLPNSDQRSVAGRRHQFCRDATLPDHDYGTVAKLDCSHYRSHSFRSRDWSERQPPIDRTKTPSTSKADPMSKYGGLNLLDLSIASEGTGIPLGKLIMANNGATTTLSSCYQRRYTESKFVEN